MIIGFKEACRFLDATPAWLRSMVFQKKIPHFKLGRLIKFKKSDLEAWIELNRREVQ